MNEYERIFSKILIEYGGKCPRMRGKRLNYLNKYTLTHLLGISDNFFKDVSIVLLKLYTVPTQRKFELKSVT